MQQCVGFCKICKSNEYKDSSGSIVCGCNDLNRKKQVLATFQQKDVKKGFKELEFVCVRCGKITKVIQKRKLYSNRKYCKECTKFRLQENRKLHWKQWERNKKIKAKQSLYAKKIQKEEAKLSSLQTVEDE